MTDKKDINAEVYKNNAKNIKLSEKQKAELIKVMRDTEKQYKQNSVSHKVFNLKTGTAAAIAAAFVFVAIYAGFFKPNTEQNSSNKNIFTITANAAEIEDKSEIGRGCGYCMPCPAGIEINNCARMSLLLRRSPSAEHLSPAGQAKMKKAAAPRAATLTMDFITTAR